MHHDNARVIIKKIKMFIVVFERERSDLFGGNQVNVTDIDLESKKTLTYNYLAYPLTQLAPFL